LIGILIQQIKGFKEIVTASLFLLMPVLALAQGVESSNFTFSRKIIIYNTDSLHSWEEQQISELQRDGFLNARTDSINQNDEGFTYYFYRGEKFWYKPKKITLSTLASPIADENGLIQGQPISFSDFENATAEILRWYSNNGFPFAQLLKKNVSISDNVIELDLIIKPNQEILFDHIKWEGNARLNDAFLENFIGLKEGARYSEALINTISPKFAELDFIELTGPLRITFAPERATIIIPARSTQANRFDGIAGLSGGGETDTPLQVTGLLNLYLSNAFGRGEYIDLSWQAPGSGTQILELRANYPYPVKLPVEPELSFELHRQDSSWMRVSLKPALFFNIANKSKIGAYWHQTTNSLLGTNTLQSAADPILNLDFQTNLYGLEVRYSTNAYYRQMLRSGFSFSFNSAIGERRIKKNSSFNQTRYDSMKLKTIQTVIESKMEKRWKTTLRSTISWGVNIGIKTGKELAPNELYRKGGFKTLIGFDELSILASSFTFTHMEFRYFTESESYFNFLINGGWYEQKSKSGYYNDFPLGLGIGLNLQTNSGIFSIMLATGLGKSQQFDSRNTKIHIGYISAF
jgi:outer membrane protein assembly factor BamA